MRRAIPTTRRSRKRPSPNLLDWPPPPISESAPAPSSFPAEGGGAEVDAVVSVPAGRSDIDCPVYEPLGVFVWNTPGPDRGAPEGRATAVTDLAGVKPNGLAHSGRSRWFRWRQSQRSLIGTRHFVRRGVVVERIGKTADRSIGRSELRRWLDSHVDPQEHLAPFKNPEPGHRLNHRAQRTAPYRPRPQPVDATPSRILGDNGATYFISFVDPPM
jgi:hypothetical protein